MPSVFTFFNGITLTYSQNRAIEAIVAFLADEKARVFILKGYAGTGKTTIVKGLTDYLSSEKKLFIALHQQVGLQESCLPNRDAWQEHCILRYLPKQRRQ